MPKASSKVTAGEIVRAFAKWSDKASQSPVFITRHGRETHALMGISDYRSMCAPDKTGTSDIAYQEIGDFINEGLIVIDEQETITYANPYARAWCNFPDDPTRVPLLQMLPHLEGSPALTQVRRTMATRKPLIADLGSAMVEGHWLNFQTFPVRDKVACLFRDITEDVMSHRLADMKKVMVDAIGLHSEIGYIRINQRGMIERADASVADWMGLSEDRLKGVRLLDLVETSHRDSMSDTLEAVLSQGKSTRCHTVLVPDRDGLMAMDCSIVPLNGAYGAEGAILVYTLAKKDKGAALATA